MFSISDLEFITNDMKIDVSSIESKLNEPFFTEFKPIAIETIAKYIAAIKKLEASNIKYDLFSFVDNPAEEFIRYHYCELADKIENDDALAVFDTLRHSFSCYAFNGLHQLYTRQENERWHPKIRLSGVLEPNDIASLEPTVMIYRGCNVREYEQGLYGQAWTTSLQVAKDFAYKHYQSQDWYHSENRVVLETVISRDHMFFSDQFIEFEVVIDIDKLENVRKHT